MSTIRIAVTADLAGLTSDGGSLLVENESRGVTLVIKKWRDGEVKTEGFIVVDYDQLRQVVDAIGAANR